MKTIHGAELFAVGVWNGRPFTTADLDSIVNSFVGLSLEGKVPLKLSHDGPDPREELDTKYALGWVRKVWRDGDTLKGDLEVPDKVAAAIDEGYLRFVSVELLRNVRADTRVIPWVLDAVALLGADQPAVGILKDLRALMSKAVASKFSCESRIAFKRDQSTTGDSNAMTDAEIAQLRSELAAANKRADEQRVEFERKEADRVKKEGTSRLDKAKALFKKAIEEDKILPKVSETFFRHAAPKPNDHEGWAEFDMDEVEQCINDNLKPGSKRFGRKDSAAGGGGDADEAAMAGMDESQKLVYRINRYCEKHGIDKHDVKAYDAAAVAVFQADPKAALAYRSFAIGESADAA